MSGYVDFADVKLRVNIEQAARLVGLTLTQHGEQFRSACPACQTGGARAIVITPSKGLFFCFSAKAGGDQIALVSHVKGVSQKDAALLLSGQNNQGTVQSTVPVKGTVPPAPTRKPAFDAAAYLAKLDAGNAALAPLGISPETLTDWKAGYVTSGVNRGRLAIALHDRDGDIIGFAGRALGTEQPTLTIPNGVAPQEIIFGGHRVEQGTLYLVRDVLDVLRANEAGVPNVVCFLSDISALQVEMLAALMGDRHCDTIELF